MKAALAVLALLFPLAGVAEPGEPENVSEARRQFMAAVAECGYDPQGCSLEYLESTEIGHFTIARCKDMPVLCFILVHPTEPLMRPLQCMDNPDYEPAEQIEKTPV